MMKGCMQVYCYLIPSLHKGKSFKLPQNNVTTFIHTFSSALAVDTVFVQPATGSPVVQTHQVFGYMHATPVGSVVVSLGYKGVGIGHVRGGWAIGTGAAALLCPRHLAQGGAGGESRALVAEVAVGPLAASVNYAAQGHGGGHEDDLVPALVGGGCDAREAIALVGGFGGVRSPQDSGHLPVSTRLINAGALDGTILPLQWSTLPLTQKIGRASCQR